MPLEEKFIFDDVSKVDKGSFQGLLKCGFTYGEATILTLGIDDVLKSSWVSKRTKDYIKQLMQYEEQRKKAQDKVNLDLFKSIEALGEMECLESLNLDLLKLGQSLGIVPDGGIR